MLPPVSFTPRMCSRKTRTTLRKLRRDYPERREPAETDPDAAGTRGPSTKCFSPSLFFSTLETFFFFSPSKIIFYPPCGTFFFHPSKTCFFFSPCTLPFSPVACFFHPSPCFFHPLPFLFHPRPFLVNPPSAKQVTPRTCAENDVTSG